MRAGIIGAALSALLFASPAAAVPYTIDASHSAVTFKVRHLAISSVVGRFGEFEGTFDYNPDAVGSSKAEASIEVKSINTDDTKRDSHLKSEDFFEVAKFPAIKFESTKVVPLSKDKFKVMGDLTIRDLTRTVELEVTYNGSIKDPQGKERAAFTATTEIDRKDFGITWSKTLDSGALVVGDTVKIEIEIEGVKAA